MTDSDLLEGFDELRASRIVSPLFGVLSLDFLVKGDAHECPYLSGRQAREEAFGTADFSPELYHDFMDHGFRRSGEFFYRPACEDCRECRSLRVIVSEYKPKKSHRRIMQKNQDVEIRVDSPRFTMEKQRIYSAYLAAQHNSLQSDSPEDMRRFLYCSPVRTREFEYRVKGRLVAAAIVDLCSRSLSTVYAFYDPEFASRSLGTFSALHEIMVCRQYGIPYYYMGYYIADCPSMSYKARFKPHELLVGPRTWVRV